MTDRICSRLIVLCTLIVSVVAAGGYASGEFMADPTWKPISAEAAQAQLEAFLTSSGLSAPRREEIRELWRTTSRNENGPVLLDRLAQCLAKADQRVAELIAFCTPAPKPGQKLPDFAWLADSDTPLLIRNNMRVYLARWLVQQGYYDEAIAWTDGLETEDTFAPDVLLFYRAIASHQLVQPNQADGALTRLMERPENLPLRYQKLADLMKHDLSGVQDGSLDHIARRMNDIRRRLAQGRPGARVQGVEQGVVESLDKLIKKAEDQAQQQAQAAAANSSKSPSMKPMEDSRIAEMKGPGKIDHKDVGRSADWGNMNDKDREKALQEIGREFPSHYREVIEEYFRRLAAEESTNKP